MNETTKKLLTKKDGTVDARFLPKPTPMIEVPPPTPVTAEDKLGWVISDLDSAIHHMKASRVDHTPLWAKLHDAKRHAEEALAKLRK